MATISEMVIKIGADASGLSAGLNKAQQDINKTFSVAGTLTPYLITLRVTKNLRKSQKVGIWIVCKVLEVSPTVFAGHALSFAAYVTAISIQIWTC